MMTKIKPFDGKRHFLAHFLRQTFAVFKKSLTFATLLKGSTSAKEFGEVAEWSIAAVLKTVVPRGTRGSNPCLSAERTGQRTDKSHKFNDLWDFFYPLVSALKYTISPLKDKVRNLTRTPDN